MSFRRDSNVSALSDALLNSGVKKPIISPLCINKHFLNTFCTKYFQWNKLLILKKSVTFFAISSAAYLNCVCVRHYILLLAHFMVHVSYTWFKWQDQPRVHHLDHLQTPSPTNRQCLFLPPFFRVNKKGTQRLRDSESKDAHPSLQCPVVPQAPTESCLKQRKQVRAALIASPISIYYHQNRCTCLPGHLVVTFCLN